MSETTEPTAETTPGTAPEVKETDWKAEARKWEERAKANRAEAQANAEAAARLAEIEESAKSAEQKQAEALAAAQTELEQLRAQALRAEVAAEKGVPAGLLAGATREELEASADALIEFRGKQEPARPSSSAIGRANNVTPTGSTADQFAAFIEDKLKP